MKRKGKEKRNGNVKIKGKRQDDGKKKKGK